MSSCPKHQRYSSAKSLHLSNLWGAHDRLRIFEADLLEEGSFDEAVKGCIGVFHVAASMQFSVLEKDNIGNACVSNKHIQGKEKKKSIFETSGVRTR